MTFEAVYEAPDGSQSRRVLSLPISIGEVLSQEKGRRNILSRDMQSGEKRIISMPARETIE